MLKLRKVAVTGGLSCGKSSVCHFFKELGAHVISADTIVHNLLSKDNAVSRQVVALFGEQIVKHGKIDREEVARLVFKDPIQLKKLEKILHPAVQQEIDKQYQQAKIRGTNSLFVVEIPLLFEAEITLDYDATIAVYAKPEDCQRWFAIKTGYGVEEFKRRMANQLSPEEKAKKANYVINNSGSLDDLRLQVHKLFENLSTQN